MGKTIVKVTAGHDEGGQIRPLLLTWAMVGNIWLTRLRTCGKHLLLKAAALGCGIPAESPGERFIYFCDEGRWFIEKQNKAKEPDYSMDYEMIPL